MVQITDIVRAVKAYDNPKLREAFVATAGTFTNLTYNAEANICLVG